MTARTKWINYDSDKLFWVRLKLKERIDFVHVIFIEFIYFSKNIKFKRNENAC